MPSEAKQQSHALWVRVSHAVLAASLLTLVVSGVFILLVHPRLYWGEAGNDLIPPLVDLRIGPNAVHKPYTAPQPFFGASGPVTAGRIIEPFNQNGWARSLHFLAAWLLVLPGLVYLVIGLLDGHFRRHFLPGSSEVAPRAVWREVVDHMRLRIPPATGGPNYGLLQKAAYLFVVFVASPLIVVTGLTMAPAVTAAWPILLRIFGGYQSARTIHFVAFIALVGFVLVHLVMVVKSGFRKQLRGITLGD